MIVELLQEKGLLPDLSARAPGTVLVACQDEALRPSAMAAAAALRDAGVPVDMVLEAKKPKWVFKHADRVAVGHVCLFAPREAEEGLVRVKRMADGEQFDVAIDGIASGLRSTRAPRVARASRAQAMRPRCAALRSLAFRTC